MGQAVHLIVDLSLSHIESWSLCVGHSQLTTSEQPAFSLSPHLLLSHHHKFDVTSLITYMTSLYYTRSRSCTIPFTRWFLKGSLGN